VFRVLKSSFDGICGGDSRYETIDEALREISYFKGWDNLEQLHASIQKWAKSATPGSVFSTQVSAIVKVGIGSGLRVDDECAECGHQGLEYEEFDCNEDGDVIQRVSCDNCECKWIDTFVLASRKLLK
jgi:hypothetical protein